jgi:hypothetical protein
VKCYTSYIVYQNYRELFSLKTNKVLIIFLIRNQTNSEFLKMKMKINNIENLDIFLYKIGAKSMIFQLA